MLGISLILGIILLFCFLNFWGEKIWFDELGYNDCFWMLFLVEFLFVVVGVLLGFGLLVFLL